MDSRAGQQAPQPWTPPVGLACKELRGGCQLESPVHRPLSTVASQESKAGEWQQHEWAPCTQRPAGLPGRHTEDLRVAQGWTAWIPLGLRPLQGALQVDKVGCPIAACPRAAHGARPTAAPLPGLRPTPESTLIVMLQPFLTRDSKAN